MRLPLAESGLRENGRGARRGLSLLEVLISMAIFLFALVALGQLIDLGNERSRDVQWLSRASMIAQSKMAEAQSGAISLTSVPDSPCEDDGDWNWSMQAEADNIPSLYRVTITVSRAKTDGTRFEFSLHEFVLDPTKRGNTDGSATGTEDTSTTGTTGTTTTPASGTSGTGTTGTTTTPTTGGR